jgi:serine/threonine protein kinase
MNLEQGITVANRYRLERQLGVGGMGEVWAATQTLTRKSVALKFLLANEGGGEGKRHQEDSRRRFLREARAACAVRHPNVVQIHDVIQLEDGSPVMVMELLEGETLEERLKREGRLSIGDLAAVMLRVISAVGTAHALGIVHRDLKPDNIFLSETLEGVEVKVLDFGIAKLTALEGDAALTGGLTNTGAMLGTPYYMSPEQAFGEERVDHRADIWSLGIILYRAISGVLPTQADNIGQILKLVMTNAIPPLSEVAPHTPADLAELVSRMLQQDVTKRPQDLNHVKPILERYAGMVVEDFDAPVMGSTAASTLHSGATAQAGAQAIAPSRRRTPWIFVGIGAALVASGAIALSGRTTVEIANPPTEPVITASIEAASSPSETLSSATVSEPVVAAATASTTRVNSSAFVHKPPVPRRPTTAATATPTAIVNTPPKEKSIGGVIEKPPF